MYISEVMAFLQEGHFAAELGNSMPLAASNALRIPIVVFTSMLNFPVLPVSPREIVLSENPIFLTYDMNYAGHYDAVDSIPQLTMAQEVCQPLYLHKIRHPVGPKAYHWFPVDVDRVPRERKK